jgi:peptide-methionine (S)-S-oxide reductase|tara:strand:+ start:492 stop:1091 length:600 start_codon:yes stop_codon:yes gene_type:complete
MIRIILIFSVLFIKTDYSTKELNQNYEKAYFASGCFWCVEGIYENIKGVIEVNSGYSGGFKKNPTYQQVMSGKTGHAEAVEIIYDPIVVDFKTLVEVFFGSHDPTTLNRQGPDRGTQYRSIAFYNSEEEKNEIKKEIKRLLDTNTYNKITTQVKTFKIFYLAEEYHQDYKKNNPYDMYIMKVSAPRINKFKMDFSELIK